MIQIVVSCFGMQTTTWRIEQLSSSIALGEPFPVSQRLIRIELSSIIA
jgi:hypothetical protein